MRGRLYLGAFVCLVVGIAAGRTARPAVVAAVAVPLVLAVLLCARYRRGFARAIILLASFALLGLLIASVACARARNGILPQISLRCPDVTACGTVAGPVYRSSSGASFLMSVSKVSEGGRVWRTSEKLLVRLDHREESRAVAARGGGVTVRGRLVPSKEGSGWLIEKGAACAIDAAGGSVRAAGDRAGRITALLSGIRSGLSDRYRRLFEPGSAGFIEGVTLGKLDGIAPDVLADLRNSGLSHIVAVSGLHVGAAAVIALAILAAAGAGRKARYAGAGMIAFAVAALAAFRPSASRALLMACLGFGAAATGRRYDSLSGLSLAGILLACSNPMVVFDQGFQFSFLAALGIIAGARMAGARGRVSRVRALLAASACAQLAVAPLVLLEGGGVPVTALAANVIAVPLTGPVLLASWAAASVSVVSETLGRFVAQVPAALSKLILFAASTFSGMPMSGLNRGVVPAAALLVYAGGLFALAVKARRGGKLFHPMVAVTISLAIMLAPLAPIAWRASEDTMTVLDVGQGDAILLEDHAGACVLVDGGPDGRNVLKKLEKRGVRRIDLVILSHAHADHVTGLIDVVRCLPVGRIIESGTGGKGSEAYSEFLSVAKARDVPRTLAREGQVVELSDSTSIEVLHAGELRWPGSGDACENLNDCSVVVMVKIGGSKALLAGDIEADGQLEMIGFHPEISCDVLKVPHQGAADAMTRELMEACRPAVALVSVGKQNLYGHPSKECLALSKEYGARLFRTDRDGDIEVSFAGDRITVRTGGDR